MSTRSQFILNFHGIGEPHPAIDTSERPYWISENVFARIVELATARHDADRILWTFDDGNKSDLTVAARILERNGRRGTFFLLTGRLDDPHSLSRDDARRLVEMGMEVGLHGRDHVDWRRIPHERLVAETVGARRMLGEMAGAPVDRVAIPFGAYNRRVIRHLMRCGFDRIYTSDGGPSWPDQRVCSRTSIRNDMSLDQVSALIDDRIAVARKLRRRVSTAVRRHLL